MRGNRSFDHLRKSGDNQVKINAEAADSVYRASANDHGC